MLLLLLFFFFFSPGRNDEGEEKGRKYTYSKRLLIRETPLKYVDALHCISVFA